MKSAKVVVDRLIAAQQRENDGKYPETIAVVLWGTDNIKTYGESLAQVMWMVGVRPVPDALGRVNKVQLIPLEELGRPRIDVVVNCSGVFRTHPRSACLFPLPHVIIFISMAGEDGEPGWFWGKCFFASFPNCHPQQISPNFSHLCLLDICGY